LSQVEPGVDALAAAELGAPRYTSYPSALHFHAGVDSAALASAARDADAHAPLSLYIHVPFCASNCFYCGCHRVITRSDRRKQDYVAALLTEFEGKAPLFRGRRVRQVHFGGGTPNSLDVPALARILGALRTDYRFATDVPVECSIEADSRMAAEADVAAWHRLGFNRLSLGVQDVNPEVQRAVNREQDSEHIARLVALARRTGYSGINLDLIYGLPLQTPQAITRTLDFVARVRPDRVAAFHYAHLPARFPAQRVIRSQDLPGLQARLELQAQIRERLEDEGYVWIGLDHFALPDDELARAAADGRLAWNFQGYTALSAGMDVVGFGASAISKVGDCYAQNEVSVARYQSELAAGRLPVVRGYRLQPDDVRRGAVIHDLMCHGRVDASAYAQRWGRDFATSFATELQRLRALDPDGRYLSAGAEGVRVLPQGRPYLRIISSAFDAYLTDADRARCARAA
jgi:oxygen-independent coproporphyrinogen III oxidase